MMSSWTLPEFHTDLVLQMKAHHEIGSLCDPHLVRLPSLEVNGIRVYDVAAVVIPDESLSTNLLGMSFLSRLRRFEMANGRLVMEQ